jgi:Histidine phosphatase superfamily (branch 1)
VFESHSWSEDNDRGIVMGWLLARLTAEIAFAQTAMPVLADWRLRECDHGALNGAPIELVRRRIRHHLKMPYPDGESWKQAVDRVARFSRRLTASPGGPPRTGHRACRHPPGNRRPRGRAGTRRPRRHRVRLAGRMGVAALIRQVRLPLTVGSNICSTIPMPDQNAQRPPAGAYRAPLTDRAFAAVRWRLALLLALTAPPRPPVPARTGPAGLAAEDGERVRVGQLV